MSAPLSINNDQAQKCESFRFTNNYLKTFISKPDNFKSVAAKVAFVALPLIVLLTFLTDLVFMIANSLCNRQITPEGTDSRPESPARPTVVPFPPRRTFDSEHNTDGLDDAEQLQVRRIYHYEAKTDTVGSLSATFYPEAAATASGFEAYAEVNPDAAYGSGDDTEVEDAEPESGEADTGAAARFNPAESAEDFPPLGQSTGILSAPGSFAGTVAHSVSAVPTPFASVAIFGSEHPAQPRRARAAQEQKFEEVTHGAHPAHLQTSAPLPTGNPFNPLASLITPTSPATRPQHTFPRGHAAAARAPQPQPVDQNQFALLQSSQLDTLHEGYESDGDVIRSAGRRQPSGRTSSGERSVNLNQRSRRAAKSAIASQSTASTQNRASVAGRADHLRQTQEQ